jgi:hypothetical protein
MSLGGGMWSTPVIAPTAAFTGLLPAAAAAVHQYTPPGSSVIIGFSLPLGRACVRYHVSCMSQFECKERGVDACSLYVYTDLLGAAPCCVAGSDWRCVAGPSGYCAHTCCIQSCIHVTAMTILSPSAASDASRASLVVSAVLVSLTWYILYRVRCHLHVEAASGRVVMHPPSSLNCAAVHESYQYMRSIHTVLHRSVESQAVRPACTLGSYGSDACRMIGSHLLSKRLSASSGHGLTVSDHYHVVVSIDVNFIWCSIDGTGRPSRGSSVVFALCAGCLGGWCMSGM